MIEYECFATILGIKFSFIIKADKHYPIINPISLAFPSLSQDSPDVIFQLQLQKKYKCKETIKTFKNNCRWNYKDGVLQFKQDFFNGWIKRSAKGKSTARFVSRPKRSFFLHIIKLVLSYHLPYAGGFLVHSSSVSINGKSLLFPAPAGQGKTTLARLYGLGDKVTILNEEISVLWDRGNPSVEVYPFLLKEISHDIGVSSPLSAIIFLEGWGENKLNRINSNTAIQMLLRNAIEFSFESEAMQSILDIASIVVKDIPCYTLSFLNDISAVNYIDNKLHILF